MCQTNLIPLPSKRISVTMYKELRKWLLKHDSDGKLMMEWAKQELCPPRTPEKMAGEIILIILCAGRRAQAAGTPTMRITTRQRLLPCAVSGSYCLGSVFRKKRNGAGSQGTRQGRKAPNRLHKRNLRLGRPR